MGQNFHICLRSGPKGLIPLPYSQSDRKISILVHYDLYFICAFLCSVLYIWGERQQLPEGIITQAADHAALGPGFLKHLIKLSLGSLLFSHVKSSCHHVIISYMHRKQTGSPNLHGQHSVKCQNIVTKQCHQGRKGKLRKFLVCNKKSKLYDDFKPFFYFEFYNVQEWFL